MKKPAHYEILNWEMELDKFFAIISATEKDLRFEI
jgi:hypothetical protein